MTYDGSGVTTDPGLSEKGIKEVADCSAPFKPLVLWEGLLLGDTSASGSRDG